MSRRARALDVLVALALLRLAAPWLAPGAQPADAGELQLVAQHLGVAHPPGYPLYTMAAHAFGQIASRPAVVRLLGVRCADVAIDGATCEPWALWPWAVSAFGAFLAAATLIVIFHAGRRLGGGVGAGLAGAAALAAAPTFVAQATVAGIRMPTALLTAAVLALALRWLDATERPSHGAAADRPDERAATDQTGDRAARLPARGHAAGRSGAGTLAALALAFALGAGHHPSLVFLAAPLAAVVLARRPTLLRDGRTLGSVAATAALGLLPLAYLPLRAGALLAPPDLATWSGFWHHATAAGFRGDVLYFDDPRTLVDRLAVLGDLVALQLGPLGLALAAVGGLALVRRRRLQGALLVATFGLVAALSITYRAPQTIEYLMPAYVALALLVAVGAGALLAGVRGVIGRLERADAAALALALLVVAAPLWRGRRVPEAVAAAAPTLAPTIQRTLGCLGSDGRLLASWHYATPLWLTALARERRATALPEAIAYVAPDFATGDPIGETWRKRAAALLHRQPLVVTNRPAELSAAHPLMPVRDTPFYAVPPPAAGAPAGQPDPSGPGDAAIDPDSTGPGDAAVDSDLGGTARCTAPPATASDGQGPLAAFGLPGNTAPSDAPVRLTAAHIGPPGPGGVRDVTLWFGLDATGFTEPLTAVVQLVEPDTGAVHGQWDRPIPTTRATAAGPAVRAALVPFRDAPRKPLEVRAGVYRTKPGGTERLVASAPGGPIDAVAIGALDLTAVVGEEPLEAGAIPFGPDLALVASRVAFEGDRAVVDLTWLAGPVRSDLTISVHITGEGWTRQHDGTPALGALPTLKWLPGWRVRDRHRIDLAGVDGPGMVSVGVYDAFSLEPLPVTDAERVRAGEGQRAIIWRAPPAGSG